MFVTQAFAQVQSPDAGPTLMETPVPPTGQAIAVQPGAVHEEAGFPPMDPEFFASQILAGPEHFLEDRLALPQG